MAKFRISALYVDLIYQIGTILRDFVNLEVLETECWTFTFDGVSASYADRNPVTYYGKGHLIANIPEQYQRKGRPVDKVQVRALCDLFPKDDYDQWVIYYWVKYPNGMKLSSHAQKLPGARLDRGWARTIDQPPVRVLTPFPPKGLEFK